MFLFFSLQLLLNKLIVVASETGVYYIIGKLLDKAWNSKLYWMKELFV